MTSTAGAHSFENETDETPILKPVEAPREELVAVDDVPKALDDPLFLRVMLGFISLFVILGVAAYLSF